MVRNINISDNAFAEFCQKHHIRKLALFGSVLRDDFSTESDVDVLVTYDPTCPVGFRIFDMEDELSSMFGNRRVDIVNEKYLNPRIRERILGEAQVRYEQG